MTTDEEKISSLYQQNKSEAPPAKLDSAILKAAHQAVEKKSSKVKSPFSGGWPAAASIAAVLIITVILVPLINQEAVAPTTKSIVEKKLEALKEQDAIGQSNTPRDINIESNIEAVRQATMKLDAKAKKQSLAKEQTRRLAPTLSSREKSSAITQDQAFAIDESISEEVMLEKTMTPVATDIISPPQAAKPEMTTMGKRSLNDESRTEAEIHQQSSTMIAADKAPAMTLTPKLWLEKIRQLIEQGELNLAQEELNQFKIRYPNETIDESILRSINTK